MFASRPSRAVARAAAVQLAFRLIHPIRLNLESEKHLTFQHL
jgi:hypothetical protein